MNENGKRNKEKLLTILISLDLAEVVNDTSGMNDQGGIAFADQF